MLNYQTFLQQKKKLAGVVTLPERAEVKRLIRIPAVQQLLQKISQLLHPLAQQLTVLPRSREIAANPLIPAPVHGQGWAELGQRPVFYLKN